MKVDRYTKIVLTIIAVGLWALVIKGVIAPQPAVAGIGLATAPTEETLQLTRSQVRTDVKLAIEDCLDGASIIRGFLYTRSSC